MGRNTSLGMDGDRSNLGFCTGVLPRRLPAPSAMSQCAFILPVVVLSLVLSSCNQQFRGRSEVRIILSKSDAFNSDVRINTSYGEGSAQGIVILAGSGLFKQYFIPQNSLVKGSIVKSDETKNIYQFGFRATRQQPAIYWIKITNQQGAMNVNCYYAQNPIPCQGQ